MLGDSRSFRMMPTLVVNFLSMVLGQTKSRGVRLLMKIIIEGEDLMTYFLST